LVSPESPRRKLEETKAEDPKLNKAEKVRIARPSHGQMAEVAGLLGQEERVMGLEPTTATLATWRSTTELHPRFKVIF
jgi:hypothetical protein